MKKEDKKIRSNSSTKKISSGSEGSWQKGSAVKGRYEIKSSKKGGMGEVYFAFDREIGRMVAIKTPLPHVLESEEQTARFYREAEAWIGLGIHPNICSAHYVQEIGGAPRLFIEYIDGGSLSEWLKEKRELTRKDRLDIVIQIALGMNHTNTLSWQDEAGNRHKGLVHRDLKPANVLMSKDGIAKVTDFGLVGKGTDGNARDFHQDKHSLLDIDAQPEVKSPSSEDLERKGTDAVWKTMTVAGAAIGTPAYMAPEQWESTHHTDIQVDIYAFGCILYEMFCGRRPFILEKKFDDAMYMVKLYQWEKMHKECKPADPHSLVPDIDGELALLIVQCLEKESVKRPESFEKIRSILKSIYTRLEKRPYLRPEPKVSHLIADSLNNQGVSYITMGQIRRAETAWREALKSDPHHIEATFNMAMFEWKYSGIPDDEVYRRMEEMSRTQTGVLRDEQLLGKMYLFFGEYSKAVKYLQKATTQIDMGYVETLKDLGLALCAEAGSPEGSPRWDEIRDCFKLVLDMGYVDLPVITGYALSLKGMGMVDEATNFFNRARKQYFDMPPSIEDAAHRFLPGHEIISSFNNYKIIEALTFSSDGRHVIWSSGNRIKVRDIEPGGLMKTGKFSEFFGHGESLGISPDAKVAVSGGNDAPLCLWDIKDGRLLGKFKPKTNKVTIIDISYDGAYALSGNPNGILFLWDINTCSRLHIFLGHKKNITATAFDNQGRYALSGSEDKTLRVWDIKDGKCCHIFEGHTATISAVAFCPDGRHVLSGSDDTTLRLWDIKTGKCCHVFNGHTYGITSVAFSSDGQYILSGSSDKTLRIWDFNNKGIEHIFRFEDQIRLLSASPDDPLLLLSSGNHLIFMEFSIQNKYPVQYVVTMPLSAAEAIAREDEFHNRIEAARKKLEKKDYPMAFHDIREARSIKGYERDPEALKLWNLFSCFPVKGLKTAWEANSFKGPTAGVNDIAICPHGNSALTGSPDRTICLWDTRTGKCHQTFKGHTDQVSSLAITKNGRYAVSGSWDKTLRFWNLEKGKCIRELIGHTEAIEAVAVSPDGRYALSGSRDYTLRLWNLKTGKCIHTFKGHTDDIRSVDFSLDGRFCISGGNDTLIRLWNLEEESNLQVLYGHTSHITAVTISPDGLYALSGSNDKTLCLWDLKKGSHIQTLQWHQGTVSSVAFSPDGKYAVSGSKDRTLRLWNLKTGECIRVFEGHTSEITSVEFGPDGQYIISASQGNIIRIWHLDWKPHVQNFADWDEAARPFLNIFLTLHTPYSSGNMVRSGKARWNQDNFQDLLKDLSYRRYGWLYPQGVREELEKMSFKWKGPVRVDQIFSKKISASDSISNRTEDKKAIVKNIAKFLFTPALLYNRKVLFAIIAAIILIMLQSFLNEFIDSIRLKPQTSQIQKPILDAQRKAKVESNYNFNNYLKQITPQINKTQIKPQINKDMDDYETQINKQSNTYNSYNYPRYDDNYLNYQMQIQRDETYRQQQMLMQQQQMIMQQQQQQRLLQQQQLYRQQP